MNWFKKFFEPKIIVEYRIVELPESRTRLKGGTKEMREAESTLSAHAGFISLTERLNTMHGLIRSKLDNERHADIRAVDFLQAGLYWSRWLQNEVSRATTKTSERTVAPVDEELEAFKLIDAAIERVS